MENRDWILLIVAVFTLVSSWGQFWIKERIFANKKAEEDTFLSFFRSKKGITFIALTGIISALSLWILFVEVTSEEPLNRITAFKISSFTVLAFLNIVLIHSLYTLRKLSILKKYIDEKSDEAKAWALIFS